MGDERLGQYDKVQMVLKIECCRVQSLDVDKIVCNFTCTHYILDCVVYGVGRRFDTIDPGSQGNDKPLVASTTFTIPCNHINTAIRQCQPTMRWRCTSCKEMCIS